MRKMTDTITRLAALRAQQNAHVPNAVPSDRLSTLSEFGSNPGALRAQYYIPSILAQGAPLVVVLHGCTQNASGYDYRSGWSRLADEAGFALLYPEQRRSNNPNLCFNWFLPADTSRDGGEALSIRQMIEGMISSHGLDRKRIFVTGLSAGGAMAAAMLAIYPEVFAGGGIVAGLPYGTATTIPEALDRMRGHGIPSEHELRRLLRGASTHKGPWPRITIWQGTADQTVAPANAEAIASQLRGVHKLGKAPTHLVAAGSLSKQIWNDDAGNPTIEINMIAGMGHGTPIDDSLGAPGPYMLDVGISSTREIARAWGVAEMENRVATSRQKAPASKPTPDPVVPDTDKAKTKQIGIEATPSLASDVPVAKKIIEDALRAAGLMR